MSVRKFMDSFGRRAWALTHIDAVMTDDGRTLKQWLKALVNVTDDTSIKKVVDSSIDGRNDLLKSSAQEFSDDEQVVMLGNLGIQSISSNEVREAFEE